MAGRATTNNNIRDLLDTLRLELKGDIKDVSNQVAALEKVVVNNEIKQAVSSTKLGFLITGITVVFSTIVTVVINKLTGHVV